MSIVGLDKIEKAFDKIMLDPSIFSSEEHVYSISKAFEEERGKIKREILVPRLIYNHIYQKENDYDLFANKTNEILADFIYPKKSKKMLAKNVQILKYIVKLYEYKKLTLNKTNLIS